MTRSLLLLASLLLACRDNTSAPALPPASVATNPSDPVQMAAPEPAAAPTVIRIVDATARHDGRAIVQMRPPSAPGALSAAMEASYALDELREVLADPAVPPAVVMSPQARVSDVRAVLASAAGPIRLIIDPNPATAEVAATGGRLLRPAPSPSLPRLVVRPFGGEFRVWLDDHPHDPSADAAGLASVLADLEPALREPGVAVDLLDPTPVQTLDAVLEAVASATPTPPALALDFAPCLPPPPDMSCVPGGPAVVGADDGPPEEAPRRELLLSTFYIDRHEVTIEQYDACHDDRACRVRINGYQNIMKPFVGPTQPAMPMDFRRAQSYCAWAGKRLPTEWEWEKAARGPDGERYPWGDDEPSCDKTVYRGCAPWGCTPYPGTTGFRWDCSEHTTKPVGSFPAGRYGLFEMAGNGYEWTRSAGVLELDECAEACRGRDPQGRCDGAFPCEGLRVLKGGSWYWPKGRLRGSHRRIEKIKTGSHRLGMRCATELPFLTRFPPRVLTETREPRGVPAPPSAEDRAVFLGVRDDPVKDKKICDAKVREGWHPSQSDGGRSELDCRDPFSYLMTNEPRGHVWNAYIADLGGAYVGIGSDQNFNHIAAARSRWAWVVDYDPRVVRNNRRLRALVLAAPTPEEFVALFSPDQARRASSIIADAYPDDPGLKQLRWGYTATRDELFAYFTKQRARGTRRAGAEGAPYGWLRSDEDYRYIRALFEQDRIRIVAGDLLRDGAIQSIGEAARALGVPVRVYYTSNAPTAWGGQITDAYRRNVLSLPFDAWSVVLRTTDGGGSLRQKTKWHHNVQWGRHMQDRLRRAGYDTVWKVIEGRIPGDDDALTLLGLPGAPGPRPSDASPAGG